MSQRTRVAVANGAVVQERCRFIKSPRHCQKLIAHCADMPPSFANPLVHAGAKHSRATFRPAWVHPAVRGDATKHGRQRDRVQRHARRGPKQCGYVIP